MNMSATRHRFSFKNKVKRLLWNVLSLFIFRPFSMRVFKRYRVFILNLFGADIHPKAMINSSVKIWAPWNLTMEAYSCLGPHVDCYNQGHITLKKNATISQKSYLCASSHDFTLVSHPLFLAPIEIGENSWVAADAFIGPGVTIGKGAVVGARAAVFKDVEPWNVVGGNQATFIKNRVLKQQ